MSAGTVRNILSIDIEWEKPMSMSKTDHKKGCMLLARWTVVVVVQHGQQSRQKLVLVEQKSRFKRKADLFPIYDRIFLE